MKLIGRVVDVLDEKTIVLDIGSEKGVINGQQFLIFGGDRRIKGLDGEDLGILEVTKGYGSVSHVQDHLCVLKAMDPITAVLKKLPGVGFVASANVWSPGAISASNSGSSYERVMRGDYARPV